MRYSDDFEYSYAWNTYTYEQLCELVDEEWKNLGEEGQYRFHKDPNPTFLMYCLSSIKPDQKIILNEYTYQYQIS